MDNKNNIDRHIKITRKKNNSWILPSVLALAGTALITTAIILALRKEEIEEIIHEEGVENYETVGNKPYIFSIT
jgi:hypothetical protein